MNKLLLVIVTLTFVSCFGGKNYPEVGEKCEITQECFAAVSVEKLEELTKYCVRKDESAVKSMIADGSVTIIMPAYKFKILGVDFPSCKLRVEDIFGETYEVWVSSQFIKEKSVN